MKSNTLVFLGLICAIFLVVPWTAGAGRANPEESKVEETKVGKEYYEGGNGAASSYGSSGGGSGQCYYGYCNGGCCSSAEEAKALAVNTAKP